MADRNCTGAEDETSVVSVVTILSVYAVLARFIKLYSANFVIAMYMLLLVGCFLWRLGWRHFLLKEQAIKPIGYGSTKKFRQEIQDRLKCIATLKPDPRRLYQQPSEQDENFFRRQILLDSAHFVHELQTLCSEVDPSSPLEDCLQCVCQKGLCSKKTLNVNSRVTELYKKARFEAGPVTEGDYNEFKRSLGNLQQALSSSEEQSSIV